MLVAAAGLGRLAHHSRFLQWESCPGPKALSCLSGTIREASVWPSLHLSMPATNLTTLAGLV